jgi:mono/diheme cytochrome c family protein
MRRFLLLAACAAVGFSQAGNAPNGKAAYRGRCAACHNPDSRQKKVGPGLKGLFQREKTTEAAIRGKIDAVGNGMPAFKDALDDHEKNDLIAYLKTL